MSKRNRSPKSGSPKGQSNDPSGTKFVTLPVSRTIPDEVQKIYSDATVIQHRDNMFTLSFLQNQWPLSISDDEVAKLKEIEQRCMAQIIVTPEHLARSLEVIRRIFEAWATDQPEGERKRLLDIANGKVNDGESVGEGSEVSTDDDI